MGLIRDMIKSEIYGNQIRKAIKEIKTKEPEQREKICLWCGRHFDGHGASCQGTHLEIIEWKGITHEKVQKKLSLCPDCMGKCKKCKRFYCPKHIKKHRCV